MPVECHTATTARGNVKDGGTETDYLYTGKEKDDVGLYYYVARYYMSRIRRWTQPDSIIQDPYDPQMLNRYSYVRNNPLKYIDPSGKYTETFLNYMIAAAAITYMVGLLVFSYLWYRHNINTQASRMRDQLKRIVEEKQGTAYGEFNRVLASMIDEQGTEDSNLYNWVTGQHDDFFTNEELVYIQDEIYPELQSLEEVPVSATKMLEKIESNNARYAEDKTFQRIKSKFAEYEYETWSLY